LIPSCPIDHSQFFFFCHLTSFPNVAGVPSFPPQPPGPELPFPSFSPRTFFPCDQSVVFFFFSAVRSNPSSPVRGRSSPLMVSVFFSSKSLLFLGIRSSHPQNDRVSPKGFLANSFFFRVFLFFSIRFFFIRYPLGFCTPPPSVNYGAALLRNG